MIGINLFNPNYFFFMITVRNIVFLYWLFFDKHAKFGENKENDGLFTLFVHNFVDFGSYIINMFFAGLHGFICVTVSFGPVTCTLIKLTFCAFSLLMDREVLSF